MEYKLIDGPRLRFKADDGAADAGTIEGYGSTFGNVDSVQERVVKGAFSETIEEFINDGFIAFAHNWGALPVATPTAAAEDDTGLKFTAEYHTTDDAQKARTVVRERLDRGKSVKLSIGYDVLEDRQAGDKVRELVKLRLFEISIVTVPANMLASVTEAKGIYGPLGRASATGLELSQHSNVVRAAIEEYTKRLDGLATIRAKAGRTLSADSMADVDAAIEQMTTALKTLKSLKDRATVSKSAELTEIDREYLRLKYRAEARKQLAGGIT